MNYLEHLKDNVKFADFIKSFTPNGWNPTHTNFLFKKLVIRKCSTLQWNCWYQY